MEEAKKRKLSPLSLILIITGVILILFGIIAPNIIFKKPKYMFSYDVDAWGGFYEVEIDTHDFLDTSTATIKIKVGGAQTKTFDLTYNSAESSRDEYVFTLQLSSEDESFSNEVVSVDITVLGGEARTYYPEEKYEGSPGRILLTVYPIFFGVFIAIFGLMLHFNKFRIKQIKMRKDEFFDKLLGVDNEPQKQETMQEQTTITCKYCGLENNNSNAKCEHCGAPIIRKKKK